MWVDLSTYCNAACPQCHRTNPDGLEKSRWLPLIQWSFEKFQEIFPKDMLWHYNIFDFCGTWGDPVMNKDLDKIIDYIIENSTATIMLTTNGSIRDEGWWWDLGVKCGGRLNLVMDIDGIDQEMHSRYRQKTNLDTVINNLSTVSMTKANCKVFTVLFKHNEKYAYEIAKLAKASGAEKIFFVPSNRFNRKTSVYEFNIAGKEQTLEQTVIAQDHPMMWHDIKLDDENLAKIKQMVDQLDD